MITRFGFATCWRPRPRRIGMWQRCRSSLISEPTCVRATRSSTTCSCSERPPSVCQKRFVRDPQVEWRAMAGLRDVLAHEYFGIDDESSETSSRTRYRTLSLNWSRFCGVGPDFGRGADSARPARAARQESVRHFGCSCRRACAAVRRVALPRIGISKGYDRATGREEVPAGGRPGVVSPAAGGLGRAPGRSVRRRTMGGAAWGELRADRCGGAPTGRRAARVRRRTGGTPAGRLRAASRTGSGSGLAPGRARRMASRASRGCRARQWGPRSWR